MQSVSHLAKARRNFGTSGRGQRACCGLTVAARVQRGPRGEVVSPQCISEQNNNTNIIIYIMYIIMPQYGTNWELLCHISFDTPALLGGTKSHTVQN